MTTCKTCKHWRLARDNDDNMTTPLDPDTYQPMTFDYEVRECYAPDILFLERPLIRKGAALADGSNYMARLVTAEDFFCALHEQESGEGK